MSKLAKVQSKIQTIESLIQKRVEWEHQGKRVVFTNGCFDILHLGHVSYLAQAADLGDILIVALNTDASVRAQNKGVDRPINPELARLIVLSSLEFVDAVVLFNEVTPLSEIIALKPDVLVKGADYDPEEKDLTHKKYIVGSKEVLSYSGEVKVIDLVVGFSTTEILRKGN